MRLLVLLLLGHGVALLIHQSLFSHDLQRRVDRVQVRARCHVRVKEVVSPGEILPIVVVEIHVVQRVMGRAVDEFLEPVARDHVAVMDEDGPDLHENEQHHVQVLLHRADEDENTGWALEKLGFCSSSRALSAVRH